MRVYKPLTEEHKEKIRQGNLGKKRSSEARKRMSLAQMGNKKAIGNKNSLGLKHSEETKRQISESLKGNQFARGYKWTKERRLKWSERLKGSGNNNWKGGVTPINRLVRNTWQYRLWT